jgi:DNA repair exonuclease SbcCD ATPase subunit
MTLTEQIYDELLNELGRGVDWQHFLNKYGNSKGPLYNAIGRAIQNIRAQIAALDEDRRKAQEEVNQSGLMLNSLNQNIKEAESILQTKTNELSAAEEKRSSLENQIERLKIELNEKNELIKQVGEIEKIGFDIERLRELKDALTEIGAKYGLKGKEATAKFFDDLKGYDVKTGLEVETQRLETLAETKKLEAERWQAEAQKTERQFKQIKGATDAVQALRKCGIKPSEIALWHNSLVSIGGVEEFGKGLKRYSTIERLLAAKKREGKRLDAKAVEISSTVNTLKEQKTEIEASIKALRSSAVTEIEKNGSNRH